MQGRQRARDVFDTARLWSVALLVVGGSLAMAGSALDWVDIVVQPEIQSDIDFGANQPEVQEPEVSRPFTGLEAGDGWFVMGAGAIMVVSAALLWITRSGRFAWLGFLTAVVIGAIAFTDYRGVGDFTSSISQRMNLVGKVVPALGLTLVAAAALIGLVGSVVGIAATPRQDAEQ
jgi:hypothetical protein